MTLSFMVVSKVSVFMGENVVSVYIFCSRCNVIFFPPASTVGRTLHDTGALAYGNLALETAKVYTHKGAV